LPNNNENATVPFSKKIHQLNKTLVEAGYPGAAALREVVCGMAAIKISSNKEFIFWF